MNASTDQRDGLARVARIAKRLNHRVIRTSYAKSAVYFLIAVALSVLIYLMVVNLPTTLP